jgi:hypothetical protein
MAKRFDEAVDLLGKDAVFDALQNTVAEAPAKVDRTNGSWAKDSGLWPEGGGVKAGIITDAPAAR